MDELDPERLPALATLDTTVALRGFGAYPDDPPSALCMAFVSLCLKEKRPLYIATPTYAEIRRGGTARHIPRLVAIEPLSFDTEAANVLGDKFPIEVLQKFKSDTGLPMHYVKYDAMIIACALRWGKGPLVTLDVRQRNLAERVGLEVFHPERCLRKQLKLFGPAQAPPPTVLPPAIDEE